MKMIDKLIKRGKTYSYMNIYGRSPAVSSNKLFATQIASTGYTTKNATWEVPLDQNNVFGTTIVLQKEVLAARTKEEAFQTISQNLEFGMMAGLRRHTAALLYSSGKGEFGIAPAGATLAVGPNTMVLPRNSVVAIDIGTQFQFGGTSGIPAANAAVCVVTGIAPAPAGSKPGSATVSFTATAADTVNAGDYLVYLGNHDGTIATPGNITSPHGLKSLFPTDPAERASPLYGINRSLYSNRLAGQMIDDSALAKASNLKIASINKIVNEIRQAGADGEDYVIILSANDWVEINAERQQYERYLQSPSEKERGRYFKFGTEEMAFSQASTWIGKCIDTPFIEDGLAYVITPSTLKIATYSNWQPLEDNAGEEKGNENPLAQASKAEEPFKINIEDFFNIKPAAETSQGDGAQISCALFYELICWNPAVNGVVKFPAV